MLEFKRTSRFNKTKISSKVRKDWISEKPAQYRITWRCEACDVNVAPGFQAVFHCYAIGNFEGGKQLMWEFVENRKRLFKTLKKAKEACEQHYQKWEKVLQCASMLAIKRIFDGRKPTDIPRWIYGRLNPNIAELLLNRNKRRISEEEDEDNEVYTIEDIMGIPMPAEDDYEETEVFDVDEPEDVPIKKPRKQRSDKGKPRKKVEQSDEAPVIKKRGRPKGSKNKVKS